jgi:general secretion pathway protein A
VTGLRRPIGLSALEKLGLHLSSAAGRAEPVFTPDALDCLFAHTNGVPRRINRIGDLALLVGFAERLDRITASEIEGVAAELTLGLAA